MTIDTKNVINSILESISRIDYIKPEDLPEIDLYMDQVTTFMETKLKSSKRYSDDKVLTKTMINNYAKTAFYHPQKRKNIPKNICFSLSLSIISKTYCLSMTFKLFWLRLLKNIFAQTMNLI